MIEFKRNNDKSSRKKLLNMYKLSSEKFWFLADRIAIITGLIGFMITIFGVLPQIHQTKSEVQEIQQRLKEDSTAEEVLYSFFYLAEQGNLKEAYNLFSEEKKKINPYPEFQNWFSNLVAFEGLRITPIDEKTSASQRVYLVEFGFKKRGMKTVETKLGYSLKFDGKYWKINYTTQPLYENGWKSGACNFYKFPEHC